MRISRYATSIALLALGPGTAISAPTLDQSTGSSPELGNGGAAFVHSTANPYQTFTAGKSGQLTKVELGLSYSNNSGALLPLRGLVEIVLDGRVLGSASFNSSGLSNSDSFPQFKSVALPGIGITAGRQYGISLKSDTLRYPDSYFAWESSPADIYLGGSSSSGYNDFAFRSYVDASRASSPPAARTFGLAVGLYTNSTASQPGKVDGATDARNVFSAIRGASSSTWAPAGAGNSTAAVTFDVTTTTGRAQIESALRSMDVKAGDTFIFYFSGHGQSFAGLGGRDESPVFDVEAYPAGANTSDETIQLGALYDPSSGNGQYLTDDDLTGMFRSDPKWVGVRKVFLVDACYSGGFWGDSSSDDQGDLNRLDNTFLFAAAPEDARARTVGDGSGLGLWTEEALLPTLSTGTALKSMAAFSAALQENIDDWNEGADRQIDGVYFTKDGIYDGVSGPVTMSGFSAASSDASFNEPIFASPVPEQSTLFLFLVAVPLVFAVSVKLSRT